MPEVPSLLRFVALVPVVANSREATPEIATTKPQATVLFWAFAWAAFFPYIAVISTGTDLQPYALILGSAVILFTQNWRWPIEIWILAGGFAGAGLVAAGQPPTFVVLRGVLGYATPFVVAAATYAIMELRPAILNRMISFSPYVWLSVGIVQLAVNRDFLISMIPTMSSGLDRGVTSLATEPSFYGVVCVFLMVLNYLRDPRAKLVQWLLLVQVVFIAQSAITILFLALLLMYSAIFQFSLKRTAVLILVTAVLFAVAVALSRPGSRLSSLAADLLANPLQLLLVDTSVNVRIGHMLFSIIGSLQSRGVPHGFGRFAEFVRHSSSTLVPGFTWLGATDDDNLKIMSGYGGALFELGVIGLAFPLAITLSVRRYFRESLGAFLVAAMFLHSVMFAAIQLSLPLLGVLIGYMSFVGQERHQVRNLESLSERALNQTFARTISSPGPRDESC